jgi:hypothetical protein
MGMKPKFNIGDWVKLKDEIDSGEKALEMLTEYARELFISIFSNSNKQLMWKNRFLKIKYISVTKDCSWYYSVNENKFIFFEEWLKKVE